MYLSQKISIHEQRIQGMSKYNSGKYVGMDNISSINLSPTETEALSFGLEFATGIKNYDMGKIINTNYKHHDWLPHGSHVYWDTL